MEFIIYHTNDIHSHFEDFFKAATYLKENKTNNNLLLDAGDFHDFSHPIMMGSRGMAGMELLSFLNYDAICPGNNETFAGEEVMRELHGKTHLLCCNLTDNKQNEISNLEKSMIIEKMGLRFLMIGIAPFSGNYNDFSSMLNIYSHNPYPFIKEEIRRLKGRYDFCLVLSHIGIEEDIKLANEIDGIDIIIGGHSHTEMSSALLVNQTIIHQAGKHGQHVGKLSLHIEDKQIIDFEGQLINTTKLTQDSLTIQLFEQLSKEADLCLSQPMYHIDYHLWHDPILENPLANFICDALFRNYPCDFTFMNSGIVNFSLEGDISKKKLLECSPSHLNPTHMLIKGSQLIEALTLSLDENHCLLSGVGPGFRGSLIGRLHVSYNVKVIMSTSLQVTLNDEPLDLNKEYHVVTTDYLQRGSGYPSLFSDKEVIYEDGFIRDVLSATLNKKDYYQYLEIKRWLNV